VDGESSQHGRTGAWPKVAPARCRELECGFIRRCHPAEFAAQDGEKGGAADQPPERPKDG